MFSKITKNIRVTATPQFLKDYSEPGDDHYVWAYTIEVENMGEQPVQLTHRHWKITDAQGLMQVVDGEGVVGEQPTLQPGDAFQYTSGTALTTPTGMMQGSYDMRTAKGEFLSVEVPAFSLDSPYYIGSVH
jgi:ApaG protein